MTTQKDIAQKLGVSVALVSRVLSGKARQIGVSEETIDRILKAAQAMGYVPNVQARILKGAPARTIGVVVYDFEDLFFAPVISALQRCAHERGYSLVLGGFERRRISDLDINALLRHSIDGLIIIGSETELAWCKPFGARGLPVVRIGSGPAPENVHVISVDEAAGLAELLKYLELLGHRRIGFIGAGGALHQRRYRLFRSEVAAQGLITRKTWTGSTSAHVTEAGFQAMQDLLSSAGSDLPSAVVSSSDILALGAYRALDEAGYRIPDDVSITGFDDIPLAHLILPALTTLRQPVQEMAEQAVATIAGSDASAKTKSIRVSFKPRLIERASCKANSS